MLRRLDRTIGAALGVVLGGWILLGGCGRRAEAPTPDGPLRFRIENYTSSTADVTIEVTVPTTESGETSTAPVRGGDDAALTETTTSKLRGTVLQSLATSAVVRVPAAQLSDGVVMCGDGVTIRASVGGAATPVMLDGDGAGTAGFDAGSVGPDGQRLLFFSRDYRCDDTIVVQITDDVGSTGAGAAGRGRVRIYTPVDVIPAPDFSSVPVDESSDMPDTTVPVATPLRVINQTGSLIEATFVLGGTLVSDGSSGSGGSTITVRVPVGEETRGTVACASRMSVAAFVISQTVSSNGVAEGLIEVSLTGAGSGTPGFDEGSVGTDYTRQLELGTHFECGATVTVTLANDGVSVDDEGNVVYSLGAGVVSIEP